jgi:hypothetical protein
MPMPRRSHSIVFGHPSRDFVHEPNTSITTQDGTATARVTAREPSASGCCAPRRPATAKTTSVIVAPNSADAARMCR